MRSSFASILFGAGMLFAAPVFAQNAGDEPGECSQPVCGTPGTGCVCVRGGEGFAAGWAALAAAGIVVFAAGFRRRV